MKTNYKGKGEHSVIQLEKIIKERETEISELKKQKYEMLEMISELLKELEFHGYRHSTTIYNAKNLIKEATEL